MSVTDGAASTSPTTVKRLLVANRGEIARRVLATCRRLGIETVAVFSDADADLRFVREADEAVRLPGTSATDTYFRCDLLVAAAQATGADAVHPGYGFLSENADFARQVVQAGLTWVGPPADAIAAMGSKVAARKLVAEVDVPVLEELDPSQVTDADLPLVVKASAGGGGRGIRVVRSLEELHGEIEQAAAEAASTFGDATVYCERYVERARHVEVQVLVDAQGDSCMLGDRDCSLQRRHQKVVEEAPAPGISNETRHAMNRTASLVAHCAGYVGVGTVEFLYDPDTGRYWFLEMNTRLQVEHPVTECVTGVDLVAAQIALAEGRPVGEVVVSDERGASPSPRGHAVEARLYAEDPFVGWQPQSGTLTRFEIPGVVAELELPASYGVRVDAGFEAGNEVGTHYDGMLAKVVAWAPSRVDALRTLAGTLSRAQIHGVRTNRDLLVRLLRHQAMLAGPVSTGFLDAFDVSSGAGPADEAVELSALAAALALAERARVDRREQQGIPAGWRNVTSAPQRTRFSVDGREVEARWYGGRGGYRAADLEHVTVVDATPDRVTLDVGQDTAVRRVLGVHLAGGRVDVESSLGHVALERVPRFPDPDEQVAAGSLVAPMPGTVTEVAVATGDQVAEGDRVMVLEAMKMQQVVRAPGTGRVIDVAVKVGDQVAAGAVLAVVHEEPEAPAGGET